MSAERGHPPRRACLSVPGSSERMLAKAPGLGADELERVEPLDGGGALAHLRARVHACRPDGDADVLDWRFVGALA